ncbi:MAG: hypothetical protein V2I48_07360 [Xanthomonadales bacterium]|jgi:hypothetical protein|nr:hypothetical protein [Xanthomonadales bacterium]
METFAPAREFVENPRFRSDRDDILGNLVLHSIDPPIRELVARLSALPCCFTLQSCYGHFVCPAQPALDNLEPVPADATGPVRYRIAYMAFCLENSKSGRAFRKALEQITVIDTDYIQFGSPGWFWERYKNSYALQVEPPAFVNEDAVTVDHGEARHVQWVRDRFFAALTELSMEN